MTIQDLIHVLLDESDLIDELAGLVVEQRESIKNADQVTMQEHMKRVQDVFFRVKTQEAQRERAAASLAAELGCEPNISSLMGAIPEGDRLLLNGAGERLGHSVFNLKTEMVVLSGLIEQNERFSAMLLSEWRRLDTGFKHS